VPFAKIASFDMDDTLITRKSGAKFPKDADDWLILHPQVGPTLQKLAKDSYKIVIFTNQNGIAKGHTKADDIRKKVANIAKELKIEMQVFVATAEDEYRKPGSKMWEVL
jgi:bifunctional polynucleotide phosphatase/kinase